MRPINLSRRFIALLLVLFTSCDDDRNPFTPPNKLPAYTEKGANTFGCLVNGEVLVARKHFGSISIPLQCDYELHNGKRSFRLRGTDFISQRTVGIILDSTFIKQDSIYEFDSYLTSNNSARFNNDTTFHTVKPFTGEIHIRVFDTINGIISGTFWFDAIDTESGAVKQVREGRFDIGH